MSNFKIQRAKDSFLTLQIRMVVGVLPHVNGWVQTSVAGNAARQWLLIAVSHSLIRYEKKHRVASTALHAPQLLGPTLSQGARNLFPITTRWFCGLSSSKKAPTPPNWNMKRSGATPSQQRNSGSSRNLAYTRGGQTAALQTVACGSFSFPKKYVFVFYFLFLLQSVQILQNGTVVASVPYSITFASRSKKIYDVTEVLIANKLVFLHFLRCGSL